MGQGPDPNNEYVCQHCEVNYNLTRCNECGYFFSANQARDGCCRQCHPAQIHDYGYKPDPIFFQLPEEETDLFFGIELEIDTEEGEEIPDKMVEELTRIKEIYLKYDSSLSDEGVEIVTHPLSYKYFRKKFPLQEICNISIENGYISHDTNTCGLHVHISKKHFGEYDSSNDSPECEANIGKFILFFESHWQELIKFSRRSIRSLERWANRYNDVNIIEEKDEKKICQTAKCFSGRYFAVNLKNEHTIEVRIFKGTLNPNTIIATIQLLQVILDFTKKNNLEKVRTINFKKLVSKSVNRRRYPELNNYCKERGII